MKILNIALAISLLIGSYSFAQDAEPTKPEKVTITGTFKKNTDSGNIAFVTQDKKRYFIIKNLHEKVTPHIDKRVKVTGGVKPGKKASTKMMVYIGKIEPASGGGGKGKGSAN